MATDAPDLSITGNTLVTNCSAGIEVAGASSGSIENNIVETSKGTPGTQGACVDPGSAAAISVSAGSVANTAADYNLIDPASTGPLYVWGGVGYADLASFTTATAQGVHDVAADPQLEPEMGASFAWYPLKATSPAIDSADASAELPSDHVHEPRTDDPAVANTGTGAGYYDRGASEVEGPTSEHGSLLQRDPSGTPLEAVVSESETPTWTTNGPIGIFAYQFNDEPYPLITTQTTIQHTFRTGGKHCVTVYDSDSDFHNLPAGSRPTCAVMGAAYDPVTPTRLMDTRSGLGTGDVAPVAPYGEVVLPLASIGATPAKDITSVVLNVTVTQPKSGGFLTVYPDQVGAVRPGVSDIDFAPGQTASVLVTVPVGDGAIRFYNGSSGTVHVLADLQGFYGAPGDEVASQTPVRVLDTRNGTGAPAHPLAAGGDLTLNLTGKVPSGTTAVVLNVGATQPTASGWLALYPHGQPLPGVSDLDFVANLTVANLVIVPVSGGQVSIHDGGNSGTVQVFADLEGYFGPQGTTGATLTFVPSGPTRLMDTRTGDGNWGVAGPVPAGGYVEVYASSNDYYCEGPCSRPAALVFNLTATAPTTSGFLTVYDADAATRPAASTLDFAANQTVSNAVMATGNGAVKAYNSGPGTVHVIADEEGYFLGPAQ
ncbi:hypothetical protein GCM10023322_68420 [Rugosimonospora acidiphila]|uniref:Right handed beta helix region n=1 Tax=Rugosimonospora acidiphila TaxID=556531 RepID=A0ABP9SJ46_9ACTN